MSLVSVSNPAPFWSPRRHADRRPLLIARNRIKSAIRAWFEGQGFVEVDVGCLQVSPGNETHLHAFRTELVGTDLARTPLYLHTSPEFAMKKLLAAGEERIFTFAPAFRNRERGPLHAPEFTMLEWYRAGAPYSQLWADCEAILRIAAEATARASWHWRERTSAIGEGMECLSVEQAFCDLAGVALDDTYAAEAVDREALAARARAAGIKVAADDTWSDMFSRVLVERIEHRLGTPRPTILHGYPWIEAALAERSADNPRLAQRFEIYVAGVELANGFGELTDPVEQRRRLEQQMAEKQRIYGEQYPIDADFLAALAEMPPSAGCALGFERLVMLAAGAEHIEHVIWTPMGPPDR